MSLGYVIRPQADQDLGAIADYLAEEAGLDTGLRFLSEAFATFNLLAANQQMGWACKIRHPKLKEARTFPCNRPFEKCLIFYQPSNDQIEILRVLYGSQDLEDLFKRSSAE